LLSALLKSSVQVRPNIVNILDSDLAGHITSVRHQLTKSLAEKSIRLEGRDPDEIEKLYRFLKAPLSNQFKDENGELHLIRGEDYAKLGALLKALPNLADHDKLHLVKSIFTQLDGAVSTTK
jgi:hypothetical protein